VLTLSTTPLKLICSTFMIILLNILSVIRTPKSSHITNVLKFLHWLNERIKYKLLSLKYKVLTTKPPQYLYNLISVQRCHNTRSSSMVTFAHPPTRSSLKITNRSFRYAAHCPGTNSSLISTSLVRHSLLHFHLSHMSLRYYPVALFLFSQVFPLHSKLRDSFWWILAVLYDHPLYRTDLN